MNNRTKKAKYNFIKFVDSVKDYTLIGEYEKYYIPVEMKHEKCGRTYTVRPEKFKSGNRCPFCVHDSLRGDKKFIKLLEQTGEYELLSEYKNNKTKVELLHTKCGETFLVTPSKFTTRDVRCPCVRRFKRWTKDRFLKEMYNNMGDSFELVSDFKDIYSTVTVKHHTCGYSFNTIARNLVDSGSCYYCNSSKGELLVQSILVDLGLTFHMEYRFDDCRNILPLPFDFYIPKYNLCIEYHGEQHYKDSGWFNSTEEFNGLQKRDRIKKQYCIDNDIDFLEIPYNYSFNKIKKEIENKIKSDK